MQDFTLITKKLESIETKVDSLKDRLHDVDKTLAAQHVTLQDHTRRSEANEKALEILRKEFKPVRDHVTRVEGALKFIGLLSLGMTILISLYELWMSIGGN